MSHGENGIHNLIFAFVNEKHGSILWKQFMVDEVHVYNVDIIFGYWELNHILLCQKYW